jgi:hypothetical protein
LPSATSNPVEGSDNNEKKKYEKKKEIKALDLSIKISVA